MGEILNNLRKHCHVISDVKIWKQKIISGNNNINREKDIILIPNKKKEKKRGKKGNWHVPKPYPKNITVVQKYNCS